MEYLNINKKLWNDRTEVHYNSDFYEVVSFLKGEDTLNSIELELLGDIKGKTILHLQCHFGMDSISLSRKGGIVTGVDFSSASILKANELRDKLGVNTRFIESDIDSLDKVLNEKFEIVFSSYGVVCWHPDIRKWASVIKQFLKPQGKFVMAEFHPVVSMFSDDFKEVVYNYMDHSPVVEEIYDTYTDRESEIVRGLSVE